MKFIDLLSVISDTCEIEVYCKSDNTGAWVTIGSCHTYEDVPVEIENAEVQGIEPISGTLIEVMLNLTVNPADYQ